MRRPSILGAAAPSCVATRSGSGGCAGCCCCDICMSCSICSNWSTSRRSRSSVAAYASLSAYAASSARACTALMCPLMCCRAGNKYGTYMPIHVTRPRHPPCSMPLQGGEDAAGVAEPRTCGKCPACSSSTPASRLSAGCSSPKMVASRSTAATARRKSPAPCQTNSRLRTELGDAMVDTSAGWHACGVDRPQLVSAVSSRQLSSAPGLVQMPRCRRCAAAAAIACSSALAAPLSATSAASLNPPAAQALRRVKQPARSFQAKLATTLPGLNFGWNMSA